MYNNLKMYKNKLYDSKENIFILFSFPYCYFQSGGEQLK